MPRQDRRAGHDPKKLGWRSRLVCRTIVGMITLHIDHPISDYAVWRGAFDHFAEVRRSAGVVEERVLRPHDDPHYVVIQLDFATVEEASAFRQFLVSQVWATSANSPALAGEPRTMILEPQSSARSDRTVPL